MPVQPTLAEVIGAAIDSELLERHTAIPARVESYDAAKQTCEAQIVIRRTVTDGTDKTQEDAPKIANVPVGWQRGGGFFAAFPLAKGDHVLLIFNEAAIGVWRETGEMSEAGDLRRHGISYPYAIPCAAPDTKPLADASAVNLVIGRDGGATIVMKPDDSVEIGGTDLIATAADVRAELILIATAITNLGGTYVAPVSDALIALPKVTGS